MEEDNTGSHIRRSTRQQLKQQQRQQLELQQQQLAEEEEEEEQQIQLQQQKQKQLDQNQRTTKNQETPEYHDLKEEDFERLMEEMQIDKNDDGDDGSSDDDEPEEDDYDEDYNFKDALKGASNFRVRNRREKISKNSRSYYKRKMMRADNRELDPEVRSNLSQANEAFVRKDLQVAQQLYLEVIKKDPKNFSAYKALGEISKAQGQLNECCNYWLLAANIHPWDTEFWGQVAQLSAELGHIDQAVYCYGRAITPDIAKSCEFILQRAILYQERKQYGKALDGFQKVRQLYPKDSNIIKYLASVYSEQKRLNDAINLYMKVLDSNIHPERESNELYPKFDWAELNILLELHLQNHSWRMGLNVLKLASRWIQNRSQETWWDENEDLEFDSRQRFEVISTLSSQDQIDLAENKPFDLPIDIRFKLGCLRLGLQQKDVAVQHFDYLLEEQDVSDLHFEAGKLLEEHGHYEDALKFLSKATKCYFEVGDYHESKQAYETLLQHDPDNLDFKLSLAENLYYLGDSAGAQSLIRQVRQSKPKRKLTEQEKEEIENNAKRKVLEKFGRMERLQESIDSGDRIAIGAWLQLASQLIEIFTNVKSFFPRDKNRTFNGIVRYRRRKDMGLDEKLARAYNLLEGIVQDEHYTRHTLTNKTEYRGLSYDQWFDIFAQYAVLISRYENNIDYADEIVDIALAVNVFIQDKRKETILRALKLAFGVRRNRVVDSLFIYLRHFLNLNQFSPFIYKLFMCCYGSGIEYWEQFASYNHQKYFLRQLKSYDSCYTGKNVSGMAHITTDLSGFKLGPHHLDLIYVYGNLLGGNKSYVSSLFYLNRAYKQYNQDPMLCLILGLGHLHRSMQRLSANRHIQLLQGISYILEYKKLRQLNATIYELQEIEYNLGRLFHTLGLFTLAVRHYEQVLAMKDDIVNSSKDNNDNYEYDMSWEAAYNLSLIYNIDGNPKLAKEIIDKYLTIV
ncbi:Tetratricopeptide repeat family protein [Candida albicans]|uniref:Tetratricopeptide repeat family protein n=1 Tax=Candida albicans TaxID=5476 RepID=A0A8H6F5W7_CANAX|nr:Tetratricopeptide repeat family protein [Candida albicans]